MRRLGVVGGIISIAGGIWLLSLRAVSANSLLASMANGIGLYCIGRGLFDISAALLIGREAQEVQRPPVQQFYSEPPAPPSPAAALEDMATPITPEPPRPAAPRFSSREEYETWKRSQPAKEG